MAVQSQTVNNLLITGVAGFIGAGVTNFLVQKYPDWNIYGVDKISYCSNIKNINDSLNKKNFKFIQGDICETDFMKFIFDEYKINIVMHFAAYSHVDHSFGNSLIFSRNNIIGTHTLLEVAKESDKKNTIKKFIHVSTDEVYGDKEGASNENSILDPTNPYSASKAAAECMVRGYYHSFKLPIIITRGNNVYGPYQYPEKAIPRFCLRLLNDQPCEIQGSGQQTRSFLYIDDVVNAFDIILNNGVIGEIYNIGSHVEISIKEVVSKLLVLLGKDEKDLIKYVKDRDFNDQRYLIETKKLNDLGWSQKYTFDEGLKLTLDWYTNHQSHWDNIDSALQITHREIS